MHVTKQALCTLETWLVRQDAQRPAILPIMKVLPISALSSSSVFTVPSSRVRMVGFLRERRAVMPIMKGTTDCAQPVANLLAAPANLRTALAKLQPGVKASWWAAVLLGTAGRWGRSSL